MSNVAHDVAPEFVACPVCGEPEMCTPGQAQCDPCAEYQSIGRYEDMQGVWNGEYWERLE